MPIWRPPAASIATLIAINGVIATPPELNIVSASQLAGEYEMQGAYVISETAIPVVGIGERITSQAGQFFVVEAQSGESVLALDTGSGDIKLVNQEHTSAGEIALINEPDSVSSSVTSADSSSDSTTVNESDFSEVSGVQEFGGPDPTVTTQGGQDFDVFLPSHTPPPPAPNFIPSHTPPPPNPYFVPSHVPAPPPPNFVPSHVPPPPAPFNNPEFEAEFG